jgi:hypothetical protein
VLSVVEVGQKASTIEARLIVNERFPALNYTSVTTSVREAKSAANLYLEYKICQLEAVDSMSGLPLRLVDNRVLKLRLVCSFLDLSQRMQPGW